MRLGVLGPVGYQVAGQWRQPKGARQRKLLAALLVAGGRVVSEARLAETLWEGDPPHTAARQLVNGTSMLRRELRAHGGPDVECAAGGYLLDLTGHELDEWLFLAHVKTARTQVAMADVNGAVASLRRAIRLWRGPALFGFDQHHLRVAAERLEDARLAAVDDLAWLELRRHDAIEALRLVTDTLVDHPFRERSVLLHMLALLALGQRTDALAVFRGLRSTLVEQLGIEPRADLVAAHQRILRGAEFGAMMENLVG